MAQANDLIDDVTGRPVALERPPIVVRIWAGLVPGAAAIDVAEAGLSPFLTALLQLPVPRIELAATTFDRLVRVDMAGMAEAFTPGDWSLVEENARLRAELERLREAPPESR